jgi:hypothetical protein
LGSKGTTTQTGAQTYTANPAVAQAGQQAIGMAQSAATQPFQLPVQQYAGFNPQQQTGFQQTGQYAQAGQPYFTGASNLIQGAGQPISQQQINSYLNPYASNVMANLSELQGEQMADVTGKLTQQAGGVGADRIAVGQSELARQQNLAQGQTLAGIYGQALSAAQSQQQAQLAAGYGLGNLGATAQTAGLQGAQANYGMGLQQQQLAQNQLNAQYANTLAQLAYPYQNAQFLAGITGGLAGALGGTTGGYQYTTPPPPNPISQIAGLGIGAAGLAGAYNSLGGSQFGDINTGNVSDTQKGATGGRVYARGGGIGYADGGGGDTDPGNDQEAHMGDVKPTTWMAGNRYIPTLQVASQAQHPQLQFSQPQQQQSGIGIGDIAKTASAILPLLALHSGGRTGYQGGGGTDFGMTGFIPSMQVASGAQIPQLHFSTPVQQQQPKLGDMASSLSKILKQNQKQQDAKDDAAEDAKDNAATVDASDTAVADMGDAAEASGGRIDAFSPFQTFYKGGHYQEGGDVIPPEDTRRAVGLEMLRQGAGEPLATDRDEALSRLRAGRGVPYVDTGYSPREEEVLAKDDRQGLPATPYAPKLPSVPQRVQAQLATTSNPVLAAQVPKRIPVTGGVEYDSRPEQPVVAQRQAPPAPARQPDADQPFKPNDVSYWRSQQGIPYPSLNPDRDPSRRLAMNPWMALAAAGFGIAGGTSPYALTNIGQGAGAGIKYLTEQRKELASEEAINQRARQLSQAAQKEIDRQTLMTPVEQATVATSNLQKLYVDPMDGTTLFWDRANQELVRYGKDPETGEVGKLPIRPEDQARAPGRPTVGGQPTGKGPSGVPTPVQANTSISPVGGTVMNDDPTSMIERKTISARRNPAIQFGSEGQMKQERSIGQAEIRDWDKKLPAAETIQTRAGEMKSDLDTIMAWVNKKPDGAAERALQFAIKPGPHAENGVAFANYLQKFGSNSVPPEVLAAATRWSKTSTLAGFNGIVAEGLSAREAMPIIRASMGAVANINLPEASNRALIASTYEIAQRVRDKKAFLAEYTRNNGGSASGWETEFENAHPMGGYVARATIGALPPEERANLPRFTNVLRQTRDEYMTAEKSGNPQVASAALTKWNQVRNAFNQRFGGTADYFAFGRMM